MERGPAGNERRPTASAPISLALGGITDFVAEPHCAIDGPKQGEIINLTDRRADKARNALRPTRFAPSCHAIAS
jgi:expansin (peptidoglycan-binding protein)